MNTKKRREAKSDFERDFFKLINNAVFGKTMENVRKHRDIKLVTTDERRNRLVSEPDYHITKWFSENLLAIEMRKTKAKMNQPIYLGLSILEISKRLMYEFSYNYMKQKYNDNLKLCYLDTDSFIMHIKTLMKDELGGKIVTKFVALRPKTYSYLTNDCEEDKKAKGAKKCVIKRRLKFNDYKDCLLNNQIVLKPQQIFKNTRHDLYTEEINKIVLSSNDDKRLQTFDRITSYPYETSAGKVCKPELLSKLNIK